MGKAVEANAVMQAGGNGQDQDDGGDGGERYLFSGYMIDMVAISFCIDHMITIVLIIRSPDVRYNYEPLL